MTNMRASHLLAGLLLGLLSLNSSASAESAPPPAADDTAIRVQRTDDGRGVLSFPISIPRDSDTDTLQATFDFGETKGFSKDNTPVVNKDKSLIAVTNYPATKTSYVHLFIRNPNGDLLVVNSFNARAAKLLKGRWAKAAEYRLEAVSIAGRIVQLKVFDYVRGNEADEYAFKVSVGNDGTLTLAR